MKSLLEQFKISPAQNFTSTTDAESGKEYAAIGAGADKY